MELLALALLAYFVTGTRRLTATVTDDHAGPVKPYTPSTPTQNAYTQQVTQAFPHLLRYSGTLTTEQASKFRTAMEATFKGRHYDFNTAFIIALVLQQAIRLPERQAVMAMPRKKGSTTIPASNFMTLATFTQAVGQPSVRDKYEWMPYIFTSSKQDWVDTAMNAGYSAVKASVGKLAAVVGIKIDEYTATQKEKLTGAVNSSMSQLDSNLAGLGF